MSSTPSVVPILGSELQQIVELFENELSAVSFPGLEAGALAARARDVAEKAAALRAVEAELDVLREDLAERRAELVSCAAQGLAYAKVYASADPALAAKVEQLGAPGARKRARNVRRKPAKARAVESAPAEATADEDLASSAAE